MAAASVSRWRHLETEAAATQLPLAATWANRATAAVALCSGDHARAIEHALASADAAQEVGAPIESALSRTLAGQALVQAVGTTTPSRNFAAQQRRSTRAARCATGKARSGS